MLRIESAPLEILGKAPQKMRVAYLYSGVLSEPTIQFLPGGRFQESYYCQIPAYNVGVTWGAERIIVVGVGQILRIVGNSILRPPPYYTPCMHTHVTSILI